MNLRFLAISLLLVSAALATPVGDHGALKVQGNKIVDKNGDQVFLKGMSLYWSQWMGQYWNSADIAWLIKDWNVSIVRAAMGVYAGGYLENPDAQKALVNTVVQACIDQGIYVIIDWHLSNQDPNVNAAKPFFSEMAAQWGSYDNVIFEDYNEPGPQPWSNVKSYHEQVVPEIRAHTNNLIICGTPSWSQDVDEAASDPVSGTNIAYTLHFYAATHKQSLRDKANTALGRGIAIFITEWGTCEASGTGTLDLGSSQTWVDWAQQSGIGGMCNWAIEDKAETCAALNAGASGNGGWPTSQLTSSGNWVRNFIRGGSPPPPPPGKTGCCSWDGGKTCGIATAYCKTNASDCASCKGSWVTYDHGCCSWDYGTTCGPTTSYCETNDADCENCKGRWAPNKSSSSQFLAQAYGVEAYN